MINQLMHYIFSASLNSAFFVIGLIAVRKIFIKFIGAKWNYYLWFCIFIPWVVTIFSSFFWTTSLVSHLYLFVKPILVYHSVSSPIVTKFFTILTNGTKHSIILSDIFFIIWLTGTLICISYISIRHLKFVSTLKQFSRPLNINEQALLQIALPHLTKKYLSKVNLSTLIKSPMLCQVINPRIYLPIDFFNEYTIPELKYVLQHEYLHLKRHDIFANFSLIND